MARLPISDPRERALVAAADALLSPVAALRRLSAGAPPRRRGASSAPARAHRRSADDAAGARRAARGAGPGAAIDLVVGSWNRELAAAIPGVERVETLDADVAGAPAARPDSPGAARLGTLALARHAARWRIAALRSRDQLRARHPQQPRHRGGGRRAAPRASRSGGGGALLDVALDYDPSAHTTDNAAGWSGARWRSADDAPTRRSPALRISRRPPRRGGADCSQPFGGRAEGRRPRQRRPRDQAVARNALSRRRRTAGARSVGGDRAHRHAGRPRADRRSSATALPAGSRGRSLGRRRSADRRRGPRSSSISSSPATPDRCTWRTRSARRSSRCSGRRIRRATRRAALRDHVVRVDLPCSPCNRIRRPPARCVGHTPDCLAGVETAAGAGGDRRDAADRSGPMIALDVDSGAGLATGRPLLGYLDAGAPRNARTKRPTPGSRHCATCASTASRSAAASPVAATRCGGSPSSTCTRSRRSCTAIRTIRAHRRAGRSAIGRWRSRVRLADAIAGVVAQAAAARGMSATADRAGRAIDATGSCAHGRARAMALAAGGAAVAAARGAGRRPHARAIAAFVHTRLLAGRRRRRQRRVLHRPGPARARGARRGGDIRYVGVGAAHQLPRAALVGSAVARAGDDGIVPIERYAPASAHARRRARSSGDRHRDPASQPVGERRAARARRHRGCDCWPLVPRAARRHRAAAVSVVGARDGRSGRGARRALEPEVAVTYAEAGGWGRALALECRRRGIPLAGLQHGFIYRHWLNYRHEADEMRPDRAQPGRSRLSVAGDDAALRRARGTHLRDGRGAFPPAPLAVTGSARLDELAAAVRAARRAAIAARAPRAGAGAGTAAGRLRREGARGAARCCRRWSRRCARCPSVQLAIKPHPAETPDVYAAAVAGVPQHPRARRRRAAAAAARRGAGRSSPSTRPWRSTRSRSACRRSSSGCPTT